MAFSLPALREEVIDKLKVEPCQWQLEAMAVIREKKHAIVIAPTGGGKTLPLTAPVLLEDDGITLIVSALNVITTQIVTKLGGKQGGVLELHGASNNVDISKEDKNVSICHHLYHNRTH
jgi:superfamily II DNA or RNA helicase